ncbi:thiol-disulfide oxidoreductase DCC family protein [Cohnella mopanensis]|uniref:thiol-disulfide oxidoreductase DCC family protein n=1 Tax=Cohnella mopanensis TaxID=2911966 RepID=UPI001EF7E101|nr:DCC1-like thiol-disulfide oxidoreductase family protein [Cohnella mopanensis]
MQQNPIDSKELIYLLIDGECTLCHRLARFVYRRDRAGRFRFAPLQSKAGQRLLKQVELPLDNQETFILIQDGRYYMKSNAALRVFRKLDGGWPLLYGLVVFPLKIRDKAYDVIARRRYRLFGRRDACMLPEAGLRERFVEVGEEIIA